MSGRNGNARWASGSQHACARQREQLHVIVWAAGHPYGVGPSGWTTDLESNKEPERGSKLRHNAIGVAVDPGVDDCQRIPARVDAALIGEIAAFTFVVVRRYQILPIRRNRDSERVHTDLDAGSGRCNFSAVGQDTRIVAVKFVGSGKNFCAGVIRVTLRLVVHRRCYCSPIRLVNRLTACHSCGEYNCHKCLAAAEHWVHLQTCRLFQNSKRHKSSSRNAFCYTAGFHREAMAWTLSWCYADVNGRLKFQI